MRATSSSYTNGTHDVVVAAAREAAHAVDRVAPGADHDHRHVPVPRPAGLALTKAAANLEAGSVGQNRIEEHEARLRLLEELEGRRGPVGREYLEPVVGQLLLEVGAERSLVLDDQNHPRDHGRRRYRRRYATTRCPLREAQQAVQRLWDHTEGGHAGLSHGCKAANEEPRFSCGRRGSTCARRADRSREAGGGRSAVPMPRNRRLAPSPVAASAVQIVRLKPERATRRAVRIYVRGPNGELERRS